ncbi:ATP-binding protein, partial [Bdellovibrionota bacterium FG-2]
LEKKSKLAKIFEQIDAEKILRDIAVELDIEINTKRDLIFIDEIQACPQALTSLGYFYEDVPGLPVIAAGSLLDFALTEEKVSMPVGRMSYAFVNPLSFEEFLEGLGKVRLLAEIRNFEWGKQISETVHLHLLEHLESYLQVGGMPEAVQTFLSTADLRQVRTIQEEILTTYRDDFGKYASGRALLLLQRLFDGMSAVLGRKIRYVQLSRDDHSRDLRAVIDLLVQARVFGKVSHTDCVGVPLALHQSDSIYKLYHLDVGLMNAQLGTPVLQGKPGAALLGQLLGVQAEQMIYQNLKASLHKQDLRINYWLREGKSQNAEVDFVLEEGGHILPIEVKSGASGSLRSLFQLVAKSKVKTALRFDVNLPSIQKIQTDVITPGGKQSVKFRLLSLPLYLVGQYSRLCEV